MEKQKPEKWSTTTPTKMIDQPYLFKDMNMTYNNRITFAPRLTRFVFLHCVLMLLSVQLYGQGVINASPNVSSGCVGDEVEYTFSYSGNGTVIGIDWAFISPLYPTVTASGAHTRTVAWKASGTVKVTYAEQLNGTIYERNLEREFTAFYTGGTVSGPNTVCYNGSGTLTLSGNSAGAITWQRCVSGCSATTDDGWSTNADGNTFSSLTATTSFRAKVTSASCGIKYSTSKTVVVEPDLSHATVFVPNPFPLCENSSNLSNMTFLALAGHTGGNPQYTWYRSSRGTDPTEDDENTSDPLTYDPYYPLQEGEVIYCKVSYSYNCTVNNPTESNHVTVELTEPQTPFVNIHPLPAANDGTFCQGESVTFSASSAQTITGYAWSINSSYTLATTPTFTIVAGQDFQVNDKVKLTVNVTGPCLSTNTMTMTTSSIATSLIYVPTLTANADTGTDGCPGGESDFSFSLSNPAELNSHTWSISPSSAGTISSSGTVAWAPSGFTGNAVVKIAATVCSNLLREDDVTVTVHPRPSVPAEANLSYCDFEPISLAVPGWTNSFNWYNQESNFLKNGYEYVIPSKKEGSYTYLAEYINEYGCVSATRFPIRVTVTSSCDDELNYIESISYAGEQEEVAHGKAYFDMFGRPLQAQTKSLTSNQVLTSQTVQDKYGREALTTLVAPINRSSFQYNHRFVANQSGDLYTHQDFGQSLTQGVSGTAGWYYSGNNSLEEFVPVTGYPYSSIEFDDDGTGEVKRSAGPGEIHRMGQGHEVLAGTFPIINELNDYLDQRSIIIPDVAQDGSLKEEGVQTVTRDQNGKYAVSIADKSGKTVFSARAGTPSDYVLSVTNSISGNGNPSNSGYRPVIYFYTLHAQVVAMSGNNFIVENIATNEQKVNETFAGPDGNWPAGFYKVLCPNANSAANVRYTNYYLDLSYQFYDDAGRLRSSISPNGTLKLDKVYEWINGGMPWGYGPSATLGAGRWRNTHLMWRPYSSSDNESDIFCSEFAMPAGTYDISGKWRRTEENGTGSILIIYYLLDKNLNVLDSKSATLSSGINETTLSLTSNQEIGYIGAKSFITSANSPTSNYIAHIEGNFLMGGTFPDYATLDKTDYEYNFQGWLLRMKEPDAGTTQYVYRKDGKIRFSQNAEQENNNRYSYTNYDEIGRPVESGEYIGTAIPFVSMDAANFSASLMKGELEKKPHEIVWADADKRDWIKTNYDSPDPDFSSTTGIGSLYSQDFVHGAVSWTGNANIQTWYSYDELGRVTWMAQKPKVLPRVFVVKYKYDFLGNVLTVSNLSYDLSGNILGQFHHHYEYDADKRLSKAYTSLEETGSKKLRATYTYYLHGPLKRIELGDQLQGIDFVYNIQGWLTQINHPDPAQDPGGDTNDAFGMVLDYYESDLANLYTASTGSAHDPSRRHGLPANLLATLTDQHQPLIRFMPEQQASEAPLSLKAYSAGNQEYKKMITEIKNK